METTLVGFFSHPDDAQRAVRDLITSGYGRDRISVVTKHDASTEYEGSVVYSDGNLAEEGATTGVTSGAVVGGIVGLLIGAGAIAFPPSLLVAGPIVGLLAGATAGAATGGVLGGLIGLGIPDEHAHHYAKGIEDGGTLVSITVNTNETERVRAILDHDGAETIEGKSTTAVPPQYQNMDSHPSARDQLKALSSDDTIGASVGPAAMRRDVRSYPYADVPTGPPPEPKMPHEEG